MSVTYVTVLVLALVVPFAYYWLVPWASARLGVRWERRAGHVVRNYRSVDVPLGLGWGWVALGAVLAVSGVQNRGLAGVMPAGLVLGAAFFGWLDDRFGGAGPKGFRGHLSALARGRVTTGLLKLAGIGALSLAAAWSIAAPAASLLPAVSWILAAAVVALTANLVNLLDLHPGRALKAVSVVVLLSAVTTGVLYQRGSATSLLVRALLVAVFAVGPAAVCLPADLRERAMLGDMGANAAGAYAGYMLATAASGSLAGLAVVAFVLLALNLASERVSFSAVIERVAVLRWFDGLGRPARDTAEERSVDGETGT